MPDCRLLVVSCPHRKPIQEIFKACFDAHWPDCPHFITILSPDPDIGWNANLIELLDTVSEEMTLLFLDDHFIDEPGSEDYTENISGLLRIMADNQDIGMCKLQAGNAASPEIEFPMWDRLREYDRRPHPFKRTNLVPTMFRRDWLLRLSSAILKDCGPERDKGRKGALEFEVCGTKLTEDAAAWPERMLGIHRPNPDGGGGRSLLTCIDNDAVREGRLKPATHAVLERVTGGVNDIAGIEAFL